MRLKNYTLGFSFAGLGLYGLQLLPNIIWMLAPPIDNVLSKNSSAIPVLNVIEALFGILTVAVLVLVRNKADGRNGRIYIMFAALFLAGYYIAWILYYQGVVSPWLLIAGIAAMPPLYFLLAGLWMKNYIVVIPCVIFGVTHIIITCSNYLKLQVFLGRSSVFAGFFAEMMRSASSNLGVLTSFNIFSQWAHAYCSLDSSDTRSTCPAHMRS